MSVGDPQSFNRYAYVGNDPVNMVDPTGLFALAERPPRYVNWFFFGINNGPRRPPVTESELRGRGGLPRDTEPQNSAQDQFTPEQFERFKGCLSSMFQVEYKDHKFVRGREAYFYGYTNRKANWYNLSAIGNFTVRTDQQSYSSEDLKRKINSYFGNSAAGKFVAGYTDPKSPYVNAIANDASLELRGAEFFGTWVHELGNSLAAITRLSPQVAADAADRYDGDKDAGTAFEDCVFGGHVRPNGSVSPPK
jgi:hypothetical protein